jgi:hypothetical protein
VAIVKAISDKLSRTILDLATIAILIIISFALLSFSQIRQPFSIGYSMGNMGTILWGDGISGRQPWNPACFYNDSLQFGVAAAGIDYYDRMDNFSSRSILNGAVGGWYAWKYVTLKAAYEHLNALKIFFEQTGKLSIGTQSIPYVSLSAELEAVRSGLVSINEETESALTIGFSAWVHHAYAALSLKAEHIPIEKADALGFTAPPELTIGLHTCKHKWGAQGVLCKINFKEAPAFRFCFGEEFWFHPMFGIHGGIATNPFMLSLGVAVLWNNTGLAASFANHPVLGWSRGFQVDWAH